MKYLIVQEWENTKNNHAGMKHMCDLLVEKYPDKYEMIVNPAPKERKLSRNFILKKIQYIKSYWDLKYFYTLRYKRLCKSVFKNLKDGDEVFLLEYCLLHAPQIGLAKYIKKNFSNVRVYGLSHLTPSFDFGKNITYKDIVLSWSKYCDKMLTLGSSLSLFFTNCGIPKEKISTGFHYVDNEYYNNNHIVENNRRLKLIVIGMLQRDFHLLVNVIKDTPQVDWVICKGHKNIESLFTDLPNVILKGYISENELRDEMSNVDISVNILEDTIGSNVITTSMAMVLAIICSDVGSIRDYCTTENCEFCNNTKEDFVKAINRMENDRNRVYQMKLKSMELSRKLSIENIDKWLSSLDGK